jgi:hypothetical protein
MNQAAAAVLDDHEYVQLAKRRRNCDEEVTGNDSLSVQAQKARPAQVASRPTSGTQRQVFAHCPRRHLNPKLQKHLVS